MINVQAKLFPVCRFVIRLIEGVIVKSAKRLTNRLNPVIIHFAGSRRHGEMAERLRALVLKTSDTERYRGFESLSLRHFYVHMEMYPSGYKGLPC